MQISVAKSQETLRGIVNGCLYPVGTGSNNLRGTAMIGIRACERSHLLSTLSLDLDQHKISPRYLLQRARCR